jgi:flagellar hook capping protein FlgD
MPLRRQHGSLLVGLIATLVLIVAAAPARATVPAPPGGPILVVTPTGDANASYYPEILRVEGLNEFDVKSPTALTAGSLAGYDAVVLAAPVTDAQVTVLSSWVQSGGNLIAMRPDKKLAPLLGLTDSNDTLSNADLKIDTTQAPGKGIASSVMQFHDTADRYALAGARSVATLYSNASTATNSPAVSLRDVGLGHAAAFTFDLARSIIATRQGNIDWAGQNRDYSFYSESDPDPIVRSNDLFFGGTLPDWVDLNRIEVPAADEQQRLLANLIQLGSDTPMPRFWYFPRGEKAVMAITGDDHGSDRTEDDVFAPLLALGPDGCRPPVDQALLDAWKCPRATSYVVAIDPGSDPANPSPPVMSASAAANWTSYGFEVAPHPRFDPTNSCADFNGLADLNAKLDSELGLFAQNYPGLAAARTVRTHCIPWSDWASQPKADLAHGIRLNTDYYYFSGDWTNNRPGMFTGSGMPMRFADSDGSLIDVYQAATYGADDATRKKGQPDDPATDPNAVVPAQGIALMDGAINNGYYGAFTMQVHSDAPSYIPARNALVSAAMSRNVPLVTERQLLTWLDGRNNSSFGNINYASNALTFTIHTNADANGLEAMLPYEGPVGHLETLTRDGTAVAFRRETIKGVEYAMFPAQDGGSYRAAYPDNRAPQTTITQAPTDGTATSASVAFASSENGSTFECSLDAGAFAPCSSPKTYSGLAVGGHTFRVRAIDGSPNHNVDPTPASASWTISASGQQGSGSTGSGGGSSGPVKGASSKPKVLPFVSAGALQFRPGAKRQFVLTVRLAKASRIVVTFRNKAGKVVRTIRVPKHKAGTVRVRWNGKDKRGRYVGAGSYRYDVTAVGTGYRKTARGSVKVLAAR